VSTTAKPSITFSDRTVEQGGGGGYGEKYWAISLSKSKRTAESFAGQRNSVRIHPVLLKKGAKVVEIPEIKDAADIEDYILDLWQKQVDAVWIGGGEQELAVINPKAIVFAKDADSYQVFGGYKSENFTLEKAEQVREQAKKILETFGNEDQKKMSFMPEEESSEPFYSQLTRTIQGLPQDRMTVAQAISAIQKGSRKTERELSGIFFLRYSASNRATR